MDQIRTLVSQPYYHLNNVMIYYQNHSFLIERDGIVDDDRMFKHYYKSDSIHTNSGNVEITQTVLHLLPSRTFTIGTEKSELR